MQNVKNLEGWAQKEIFPNGRVFIGFSIFCGSKNLSCVCIHHMDSLNFLCVNVKKSIYENTNLLLCFGAVFAGKCKRNTILNHEVFFLNFFLTWVYIYISFFIFGSKFFCLGSVSMTQKQVVKICERCRSA